jgi:hypothetical protein
MLFLFSTYQKKQKRFTYVPPTVQHWVPTPIRFQLDRTEVFGSKLSWIWWSFLKTSWTFANFVKLLQSSTDFCILGKVPSLRAVDKNRKNIA